MEQQTRVLWRLRAVQAIAEDRCAEMGEMHTQLVGAAGFGIEPDELKRTLLSFQNVARDCSLAASGDDEHPIATIGIGTEANVDDARGVERMGMSNDSNVFFFDGVILKRGGQVFIDRPGARQEQQSRSIAIQAMKQNDFAESLLGQIEQIRSGRKTRRLGKEPGRFVDRNQFGRFGDDPGLVPLARNLCFRSRWIGHFDAVAVVHFPRCELHRSAVESHFAGTDRPLHGLATPFGKLIAQHPIEPGWLGEIGGLESGGLLHNQGSSDGGDKSTTGMSMF